MRNRTAIRLLYILAVLAGVLPPVLFLAYAFQQSVAEVAKEVDFVGSGTASRAETVIDTVSSTLRKVATITQGRIDAETVNTLRQAVFLDRYVQAIGIREGRFLVASSSQDSRQEIIDATANRLPDKGGLAMAGPALREFTTPSLVLLYSFDDGRAVEGLVNPAIFNEFFDRYALQSGCRIFVYLDDGALLTSFGTETLAESPAVDLSKVDALQWHGSRIAEVTRSERYPIHVVTVTNSSTVVARWAGIATKFGLAGMLVSALLTGLVIRVVRRSQSLEADLREAVRFKELLVYYQPIMDLETGRCAGAEALMRWRHPVRGMIPAADFIDLAERTDLILPMTDILLKKIGEEFAPLLTANPDLSIGINLAPQHFSNTRFVDAVRLLLFPSVPAKQVVFEITERGLVSEKDSVARSVMTSLAAAGAKLAVDDFGTGYSSLSYLQRFPLDFLKIDKAFVDGIESETSSSGLVDQIIRIAQSLNMSIIAEGVEHASQAIYLKTHQVDYAQGWHFAKPMPIDEFEKFVLSRNSPHTRHPSPAPSSGSAPV